MDLSKHFGAFCIDEGHFEGGNDCHGFDPYKLKKSKWLFENIISVRYFALVECRRKKMAMVTGGFN